MHTAASRRSDGREGRRWSFRKDCERVIRCGPFWTGRWRRKRCGGSLEPRAGRRAPGTCSRGNSTRSGGKRWNACAASFALRSRAAEARHSRRVSRSPRRKCIRSGGAACIARRIPICSAPDGAENGSQPQTSNRPFLFWLYLIMIITGLVYRGPELVHDCVEAIRRRRDFPSRGPVAPV